MTGLAVLVAVLAQVVQVAHDGVWRDDAVHWRTDWRSDQVQSRVSLSTPLPDNAHLLESTRWTPVHDPAGRVIALDLDPPDNRGQLEIVVPHPVSSSHLSLPLLDTDGVQRVTLDGVHFRPDSSLGFEKHIRFWTGPNIRPQHDFERPWRARSGRRANTWDQALYFRDSPEIAHGIPGQLTLDGGTTPWTQGLLGLTLGLVLLGAGGLYKGLDNQARAEKNASYIRENFE